MTSDAKDLGFTPEQLAAIQERRDAQKAVSVADNTNTAEVEVSAIMGRIRKAHSQLDRERSENSGPNAEDIKRKLADANYPGRAISRLDEMFGPGLEKAKELEPMILAGDCTLVLYGDRGPGKTQMATYWGLRRGLAGKPVGRYIKTFDLLQKIKASWDSVKESENEIIERYRKTAFLILDEFQERQEGEWDNRTIVNLLDHRYDSRLVTVIIANLNKQEIMQRIPASILSRTEETGGRVHCNWQSYRALEK